MTARRQTSGGVPASIKILLVIGVVVILLTWYSLRFVPYFDVAEVEVQTTDERFQVPVGATRIAGPLKGLSQFELNVSDLQKQFNQLSVVQSATVKRDMPSRLTVSLELLEPQALVAAVDDSGAVVGVFVMKNDQLHELFDEDRYLYGESVFTIEVPVQYAALLQRYGVDEGLKTVLRLVQGLGNATEHRNTLITKIKYDNNSSSGFGRMVLEIPSCNAQLWVREPVSAQLIVRSIALIVQDEANDSLSFLDQNVRRYDLYADAMVRR